MKSFSVTFSLTLDVVCQDHLDIDWVVKQFCCKSDRFTTLHIQGDPDEAIIQAAYSCLQSTRRYADIAPTSSKAGSSTAAPANPAAFQKWTDESARRIWRARHPFGPLFNWLDKIL
jgi:hypothetical protein